MTTLEISSPEHTAEHTGHLQRIVLVGFMGAGKSTVGRLLAAQLGWRFMDTDVAVEQRHGTTIAEMFQSEGEGVFRRRESSALARALGEQEAVIAVGGGAPELLTNRLLLEQTDRTAVVFLDAPFDILFDRCVLQEGAAVRPVLLEAAEAAERFQRRLPFYRLCAQLHLRTMRQSAAETVDAVLEGLSSRR